ncbi:MAG: hypothetical protein WCP85_16025 [Mariniphaga sp.]
MNTEKTKYKPEGKFHLDKWFLDFVGENGECMIFYSAKLTWHGWSATYTSWLNYDAASGVRLKSRFGNAQFPTMAENQIAWTDKKFGISGTWEPLAENIQARIFESDEGFLDWECFQPASNVKLKVLDKVLEGKGYAEKLTLTVPPWKVPMDELRWGHFNSDENNMVWIELKEKEKQQWLWLNGELFENCTIEDDRLSIPEKDMVLNLDRSVVLESEKKIFSLMGKIIRYIPGFNKVVPTGFLMADETKWFSKGLLQSNNKPLGSGFAIHEFVNFKPF